MPLAEPRVLEHNRNQDKSELSAQPLGFELPPALRADLLDPELWQDGLAKYARGTNLAVALADAAGRLIGSTINPRPTWSLLYAKIPPTSGVGQQGERGVPSPWRRFRPATALPTPWPQAALSWRATKRG